MFDNKFIITLIGLTIAIFAISNFNTAGTVKSKEGFLGNLPSMKAKVISNVQTPSGSYSIPNQYTQMMGRSGLSKGDMVQTGGTFQNILEPRFSNTDYGANIRYNMPPTEYQASPCNPLTFSKMAREGYSENYGCGSCGGGCSSVGCKKGGGGAPHFKSRPVNPVTNGDAGVMGSGAGDQPGFAAGDFNEVSNQVYKSAQYPEATSMIPVGDMTTMNSAGEIQTPIVYDRFIFANRNSNLRSRGDPIRGDLPIVPCASEWFRPSVHPQLDLQEGALNVMGGFDNETNNALSSLMFQSSGGTDQTLGGINLNNLSQTNMANQFSTFQGTGVTDLNVSAYP